MMISASHNETQIHEARYIELEKRIAEKSYLPQPMIDFEEFESIFHSTSGEFHSNEEDNSIAKYNNITTAECASPQAPQQPHFIPYSENAHRTSFFDCVSSRQVEMQQRTQISNAHQNISSLIAGAAQPPLNNTLILSELPCIPMVYNANQSADILQNCQIVDEIVETRAKELAEWQESNTEDNSQAMVTISSQSKQIEDDLSRMSQSSSSSSSMIVDSSSSECSGKLQRNRFIKKRICPDIRDNEERKNPKKEQNKIAATRYRQKKKQEREIILSEEQELSNRNMILESTLVQRKCEVKYLKKLIRESYRNKNF